MKLAINTIVKNEMGRYLSLAVANWLTYADEVRAFDDGSTDGTYEYLLNKNGVYVLTNPGPTFFEHEGKARQQGFEWTLEGKPTHIVALDADEFIEINMETLEEGDVWTMEMREVWKATPNELLVRTDGGWRPHPVPILYRAPTFLNADWTIMDRKLACGREPLAVRNNTRWARDAGVVWHFGWADESKRQERFERYVTHDNGQYHNRAHLQSIMFPDSRVRLQSYPWSESLAPLREHLLGVRV